VVVAVFGQLDHLLRERDLTIADLKRQIEERDGLVVDGAVLDQLASRERLAQPDMTTVGAVASTLGVSLDDLLLVVTIPYFRATRVNLLNDEETWRLWTLLGLQERRKLSNDEQRELDLIGDEVERRSSELFWRNEAERRGVSFEELRDEREEDERVARAMKHRDWPDAGSPTQEPADHAEAPRTPASR